RRSWRSVPSLPSSPGTVCSTPTWPFTSRLKRGARVADTSFEGSMTDTPELPSPWNPQPEGPTVPRDDAFAPPPAFQPPPLQSFGVNASAELVADLIAATGLLPPDRLAQARGRAAQTRGSLGQALLD